MIRSVEEFMARFTQTDAYFKQQLAQAAQEGKVLRYVGEIIDGKCKVSIAAVDETILCSRSKMARTHWLSTAATINQFHYSTWLRRGYSGDCGGRVLGRNAYTGWKLGFNQ